MKVSPLLIASLVCLTCLPVKAVETPWRQHAPYKPTEESKPVAATKTPAAPKASLQSDIIKTMEQSANVYTGMELKKEISPEKTGPVLPNQLHIVKADEANKTAADKPADGKGEKTTTAADKDADDKKDKKAEPGKDGDKAGNALSTGADVLQQYTLSDEAAKTLRTAVIAYHDKKYEMALRLYQNVQELAPDYPYVNTLIGDVYFTRGEYKMAIGYYEKAIAANFIDYQAHWFMADALWKLGEKDLAVREMTLAHLMNVNHQEIYSKLKSYRNAAGRPWKEWTFTPQYDIEAKDKNIFIRTAMDWMGYAFVKALWQYEPGYAAKHGGASCAEGSVCVPEEKEALAAMMEKPGNLAYLDRVVRANYVDEMIIYEIQAKREPNVILLLPKNEQLRLANYIDMMH